MIFFKFRGRKIKITVEKEITDWDMKSDYWSNPEKIAQSLRYDLEKKINEKIIQDIEIQIQEGLIHKLAEKVIADFDLKEMYGIALKEKIMEIMFNNKNVWKEWSRP